MQKAAVWILIWFMGGTFTLLLWIIAIDIREWRRRVKWRKLAKKQMQKD